VDDLALRIDDHRRVGVDARARFLVDRGDNVNAVLPSLFRDATHGMTVGGCGQVVEVVVDQHREVAGASELEQYDLAGYPAKGADS